MDIPAEDPRAIEVVTAIREGNVAKLQTLIEHDRDLATARIVDNRRVRRALLHIVADWPGHCPNARQTVELLMQHGADVDAAVNHPTREEAGETPLHWAASSDDVALIDALLDAGANIEAPGAIFTGGAPMSDAVVFAQWNAARRLLERGAATTFWQAAALGLLDAVRARFDVEPVPWAEEVTNAFWNACRGGHRDVAEFLLARGADLNRIGPDDEHTPLQVAQESGNADLVAWLRASGAE